MKKFLVVCLLNLIVVSPAYSGEKTGHQPAETDKCPVCGMFVSEYTDWLTEIVFKDGTYFFFDGMKDLAKFYLNLKKYDPQKSTDDIEAILVKEYYGLQKTDAYAALYVIGSDIYGPMGKELIPFANREDAEVFLKDHQGKKILQFSDITPAVIEKLK